MVPLKKRRFEAFFVSKRPILSNAMSGVELLTTIRSRIAKIFRDVGRRAEYRNFILS
jgi:hypothetical protein